MGTNSLRDAEPRRFDRDACDEPRQGAAALEQAFIDEFLATRGCTLRSINRLPPGERECLLRAALRHASVRLAEAESRAHLIGELAGREGPL